MTENELFNLVTQGFEFELPPLLNAMLEECCENIVRSGDIPDEDKPACVFVAFKMALPILQSMLEAGLAHTDTITLNYRGKSFLIGPDHFLLKLKL